MGTILALWDMNPFEDILTLTVTVLPTKIPAKKVIVFISAFEFVLCLRVCVCERERERERERE